MHESFVSWSHDTNTLDAIESEDEYFDSATNTLSDTENSCTSKSQRKSDKKSSKLYRHGVTDDNLFLDYSRGCLDIKVLKKLGLTSQVMKTNDFLFFYQLILQTCDTEKSGVKNDGRLSYYSKLEEWSNLYAYQIGLVGTYGHEFKSVSIKEILKHDACIKRDGVRGGSLGAIYCCWQIRAN